MLREGNRRQDLFEFGTVLRARYQYEAGMEQFDREAPLFDRRLHVLVQYPDRDEKLTPLTIRLLHGVRVRGACLAQERERESSD